MKGGTARVNAAQRFDEVSDLTAFVRLARSVLRARSHETMAIALAVEKGGVPSSKSP
jgi:hypothetical protein